MQDCRPMAMPLVTNWRKLDASRVERVDVTVYRKLIKSLTYLSNTRRDICFAVNQLSQFMMELTRVHWVVGKHVLRYLRGTTNYGLWYRQVDGVRLEGFTYADWATHSIDQKSTSGDVFSIRSAIVSLYNRKQRSVALSSAKAKYMTGSLAACEAIWMRKLLVGLFR